MIMKNIKVLTILGSLLLFCNSCSKSFLEINPFATVSEQTLSTKEGVAGLLIGAYSLVDGGGATGGGYVSGWTALLATDDARQGSDSGVTILDAYTFDATESRFNNRWAFLYAAIQRCNDVLNLTNKVQSLSEADALQFKAEARFLRGFYYLQLATLWKNVPFIDENVSYSQANYLVSNTPNIYPKIEEDLKFASDNLTATKSEVGRANKWAAKSFLVKAYMFQKKFSEAKTLLDDIIANGVTAGGKKYALQAKYGDNFKTATRNSSETVFAAQMSVNDGSGGSNNGNAMDNYNGPFGSAVSCCYGWYSATFDLVDAFQTDPVTGLPLLDTYSNSPIPTDQGVESNAAYTPFTGTLDSRLDWSVGRRGIPYLDWGVHPGKSWIRNQYTSGPYSAIKNSSTQASVATDRQGGGGGTNTPLNLIRFADVLLWAAECEVEVGTLSKAESYVNLVRARAANPAGFVYKYLDNSKPMGGYSNVPAANYKVGQYTGQFTLNGKAYARKAVRFERRLELAMEHHRQLDMRRYDGNDYDMADVVNKFMKSESLRPGFNTGNRYIGASFTKGKHELFPIPQTQIDLSIGSNGVSVLTQNPNWK
jgi:hypothetical protein